MQYLLTEGEFSSLKGDPEAQFDRAVSALAAALKTRQRKVVIDVFRGPEPIFKITDIADAIADARNSFRISEGLAPAPKPCPDVEPSFVQPPSPLIPKLGSNEFTPPSANLRPL